MPDFDKSIGQGVEQKTSDEFISLDSDLLDLLGFTIFVCKGYLTVFKGYQTVIRYGHPMGVTSEIFKDVLGVFDWVFNVNDPLVRIKTIDQLLEALRCLVGSTFTGKM